MRGHAQQLDQQAEKKNGVHPGDPRPEAAEFDHDALQTVGEAAQAQLHEQARQARSYASRKQKGHAAGQQHEDRDHQQGRSGQRNVRRRSDSQEDHSQRRQGAQTDQAVQQRGAEYGQRPLLLAAQIDDLPGVAPHVRGQEVVEEQPDEVQAENLARGRPQARRAQDPGPLQGAAEGRERVHAEGRDQPAPVRIVHRAADLPERQARQQKADQQGADDRLAQEDQQAPHGPALLAPRRTTSSK